MNVIINPGTGACVNATEQNAIDNLKHLLLDCNLDAKYTRYYDGDGGDGRYTFIVWYGNTCAEIQMPGLPLSQVRWMDHSQDIWQFPRIYIDGSSWIWKVAIDIMRGIIADTDNED